MKNSTTNPFYNPLTPEEGILSLVREWVEKERNGDKNAREQAAYKIKEYLVETADGSYTLRSKKMDNTSETMHTIHGAFHEAKEKFVNPAGFNVNEEISILDICSGLGINAAAALEKIMPSQNNVEERKIEIDMVEISWETLAASLIIPSPSEYHQFIKKAIETYLITNNYLKFCQLNEKIPENIELHVHCQDAREMVKNLPPEKRYHAVFLDPFSPAKSPELYSYEFLLKISSLLKEDGVILTYTAAAPVRYALIDIGLEVGEGPAMGRSGGTIASPDLSKISKPLSRKDERMIALSDAGIPFRDPELSDSAENMIKRRQLERETARNQYKMASTVKTPVYLADDVEDARTKRRVLNHLKKFKITDLYSERARFLVCPQYTSCICHCEKGRGTSSRTRVKEMEHRLKMLIEDVH
jgi:tRNA U34 5-methylaminomethyl-2-thiouridine-forming methyltransferase MnmC